MLGNLNVMKVISEPRKMIHKQSRSSNKEIEKSKMKQMEVLEVKNIVAKLKNVIGKFQQQT